MTVPRCEILITDRPVDGKAITCGSLKVEITPTLGVASPQKRLPAYLITADPVEGFFLGVRMFLIFYEEMLRVFAKRIATTHDRIITANVFRDGAAVFELPRHHVCSRVIDVVLHIASAFKHKCLQAALGKLFRGPTSTDARTDDNSVKRAGLNSINVNVSHHDIVFWSMEISAHP